MKKYLRLLCVLVAFTGVCSVSFAQESPNLPEPDTEMESPKAPTTPINDRFIDFAIDHYTDLGDSNHGVHIGNGTAKIGLYIQRDGFSPTGGGVFWGIDW